MMYNGKHKNDDMPTAREVFNFLCDHESIVSSSYHGILWSALLNRKVAMEHPHSDKFFHYPFHVPFWKPHEDHFANVNGTKLKSECITENIEFYNHRVKPLIKM